MTVTNDIIGVVFLLLLIIIYIPQYHKICKNRSSQGLNAWFMFFGHTAAFWTWSNTLIFYINGWWTCQGTAGCMESFIGVGIVVVQWLLYLIMYLLYLYFLHEPNELYYGSSTRQLSKCLSNCRSSLTNKFVARSTFTVSVILSLIKLTGDLVLLHKYEWHNPDPEPTDFTAWTAFAEVIILTFFLIHYIPQIYETYQQKSAGAISLITLAFMCPGTFMWTVYLALQGQIIDDNQQASDPIVWVPYLVVFVMQGVLLYMGLYYERKKRQNLYLLFKDTNQSSTGYLSDSQDPPETLAWGS